MIEQHPHRATILPVLPDVQRPLWSVMIPTYNCAEYLRETLTSVLAQDLGPDLMQIEVIDDCSTQDDPKAIVEELGKGRVQFYQQPQNIGYIKNFETCLQRSDGKLIHLLHGDDYVRHGFYRKTQRLFEDYPQIGAAFCRHIYMDSMGHWKLISPLEQQHSGILENGLEQIVLGAPLQCVAMVVRRDVYEHLGGFDRRFVCCYEDREMWMRIAVHYPIGYETDPLAVYRLMSHKSLTKRTIRSGEYAQDINKGLAIFESYILKESISEISDNLLARA